MPASLKFIVLFGVLIIETLSIKYEGDSCTLNGHSNAIGKCVTLQNCPTALTNLRMGKNPSICVFDNRTPIVCCETKVKEYVGGHTNERISVQKCNEYKKIGTQQVEIISLALRPTIMKLDVSGCTNNVALIVGGKKAKKGEVPHMAALGWTRSDNIDWLCAASIISERWLLSAAHCKSSDRVAPDVARLGTQDLAQPDFGYDDYKIDRLVTPKDYTFSTRYNDILLLRLDRTIEFHKNVRPACLWQDNEIRETSALASGWGKTTSDSQTSNDLMIVKLDIYRNSACSNIYLNDRKLRDGVKDSQLCVGVLDGGKDTCQGDSGGPLQITVDNNHCVYYLIGVTSFGNGCAAQGNLGIYTRVSSYIDWIEQVVWN